jgi:hypothetical protein
MMIRKAWTKEAYYINGFYAIIMWWPQDLETTNGAWIDDKSIDRAAKLPPTPYIEWTTYDGEGHYQMAVRIENKTGIDYDAIYDTCYRGVYDPDGQRLCMLSTPYRDADESTMLVWQKGLAEAYAAPPVRQFGLMVYDQEVYDYVFSPIGGQEATPLDAVNQRMFDQELYPGASEWRGDPYYDPKGYAIQKRRLTGQ